MDVQHAQHTPQTEPAGGKRPRQFEAEERQPPLHASTTPAAGAAAAVDQSSGRDVARNVIPYPLSSDSSAPPTSPVGVMESSPSGAARPPQLDTSSSGSSSSAPGGGADSSSSSGEHSSSGARSEAMTKRLDYLSWDDYFMAVAFLSALRSKDPSTQVGACIVDADQRIVGIGYNGLPRGISDDALPWARTATDPLDTKYPYVCHAELNAILNKNAATLKGCRLYVALFPCNECAKLIIQSSISEVIFVSDKYHDATPYVASRRLLNLAGVTFRQHVPKASELRISFSP